MTMKRSLYRKARPGELTTRALIDALVAAHPHEAKPGGTIKLGLPKAKPAKKAAKKGKR